MGHRLQPVPFYDGARGKLFVEAWKQGWRQWVVWNDGWVQESCGRYLGVPDRGGDDALFRRRQSNAEGRRTVDQPPRHMGYDVAYPTRPIVTKDTQLSQGF